MLRINSIKENNKNKKMYFFYLFYLFILLNFIIKKFIFKIY